MAVVSVCVAGGGMIVLIFEQGCANALFYIISSKREKSGIGVFLKAAKKYCWLFFLKGSFHPH